MNIIATALEGVVWRWLVTTRITILARIRNADRGARVQLFVHSETDQPPAVGVPRCVTNSLAHGLTAPPLSALSEFSGTVFTGRMVRSSATNALHEVREAGTRDVAVCELMFGHHS